MCAFLTTIVLALAAVALLGPSLNLVLAVVIVTTIPGYARLARTSTLALKNTEFIIAERSLGASPMRIMLRHIMPNVIGPLLILIGMVVAGWLPLRLPGSGKFNQWGEKLAGLGFFGEFLLGALFALSFCPVSAAIFFATLLPLSIPLVRAADPWLELQGALAIAVAALPLLLSVRFITSGRSATTGRM